MLHIFIQINADTRSSEYKVHRAFGELVTSIGLAELEIAEITCSSPVILICLSDV
jgi:hypothetical protein